jgi:pilus assembly protein TadC
VNAHLAAAVLLLAAALLLLPHRGQAVRARLSTQPSVTDAATRSSRTDFVLPIVCGLAVGGLTAVLIGGGAGVGAGGVVGAVVTIAARRWVRPTVATTSAEPTRLAGAWDLLAACLRAGLPVASATRAVADDIPGAEGQALRRVAELLALGADPDTAWQPALATPGTLTLARSARRTAHSGAAMAAAVVELADQLRASAADRIEERTQRVGVLITAPLGLCFLPAFFCLGVLPVVIGLAGRLTQHL